MTDRPILFSPAMVLRLMNGQKTQTRRILKRPTWAHEGADFELDDDGTPLVICKETGCLASVAVRWKVGDRLWVKEGHCFGSYSADQAKRRAKKTQNPIVFATDRDRHKQYERFRWRPSIHMPRWASRLTLTVTDVRVERLQDISKEDAAAEGMIKLKATGRYVIAAGDQYLGFASHDPRVIYEYIWSLINGEESWATNPWVVALTFTIERANIDSLTAAA